MERKKTRILSVLFVNLPITLVLCVFAQLLAVWKGEAEAFSFPQFLLNIPIAYVSATVIGLALPSMKWGMAFAAKCHAEPGSLKFALLLNVVVNSVYTVCLCIIMTFVNVYLLAHAPMVAVVFGVIQNLLPLWAVCYLVSFFCAPVCQRLAEKF